MKNNYEQFKLTKEEIEKRGLTQEMLSVFPKSSEVPEGFITLERAIEYINNLAKTDPTWKWLLEQSVRK